MRPGVAPTGCVGAVGRAPGRTARRRGSACPSGEVRGLLNLPKQLSIFFGKMDSGSIRDQKEESCQRITANRQFHASQAATGGPSRGCSNGDSSPPYDMFTRVGQLMARSSPAEEVTGHVDNEHSSTKRNTNEQIPSPCSEILLLAPPEKNLKCI